MDNYHVVGDAELAPPVPDEDERIKNLLHPVGTIIESTTCDTMAKVVTAYGGTTWIRHSGYVLRGATSGVSFNGASSDGGSDSVTPSGTVAKHTLTINEIPSHTHRMGIRHSDGTKTKGEVINAGLTANQSDGRIRAISESTGGGASHNHGLTMNSQNNLPSYKNVYIWERTA